MLINSSMIVVINKCLFISKESALYEIKTLTVVSKNSIIKKAYIISFVLKNRKNKIKNTTK